MTTLLRGVRRLDLDGGASSSEPVDVLLCDGVVAAISGPNSSFDGDSRHGADVTIIDAEGRWLMPGLWDHHVHPTAWAAAADRLDLAGATHRGEATDALHRYALAHPEEVVAANLWCGGWPQRPTAADLEQFPMPVTIITGDSHSALMNAAAAQRYRVHPDPEGWIAEGPWFAVMAQVGASDDATEDRRLIDAAAAAAARGIVGIVDLDPHDTHAAWRRRVAAGFAAHRVQAGVWIEHLDAAIDAELRTGDPVPGAGPLVRMGPFKVIADGSLNTQTAHCRAPFPSGGRGAMNIEQADLIAAMTRARAAGIESTIHAIGDAALGLVLDAFEASGARGSIEHVQLASTDDVARMARLGLAASVQPWHLIDDRDVAEILWAGRTDRAYVFADLHRAGVPLRLGSDAPVAALDPWRAIMAAVLRTGDGRGPWHPEQAIDVAVALRASWGHDRAGGGAGVVDVGSVADLVLLDDNPMTMPVTQLPSIGVAVTICDGQVTHSALETT